MRFQWYWRQYGANIHDPASYNSIGVCPPNCPGTGNICAIYAEQNELTHRPIIDSLLISEMITALSTKVNQPRVNLRFND